MNRSRIPSPARSLGVISTPRKHTPRRSRSLCSAKSNGSVRLTKVIPDSFHLSPMPNRRSVLNDDTNIEIPGRKSWWKKLGENPIDMKDLLTNKEIAEVNNVAEEFDVEILSQEKKNYSLNLPESSDGESINSIVIPQRKLFTQKENQAQKKFEDIIDNRETLAKLQKSYFDQEKDIDVGPKNLFNKAQKPRTKPAFPAALLNISSKAVNKTKEMPAPEVKGQVCNLFGNRPGTKRKNFFADFIVSESEDEIPDIQPKVFGFQKNAQKRRESSASRGVGHSPTSSIDLELDDWKHLPSSTMVENQLEEATTPVKRARLSKLSEAKETESINTNSTVNKMRQSNKSATSKNKSKASISKLKDKKDEELLSTSKTKEDLLKSKKNRSLDTSSYVRMTINKSKSISPLKVGEPTKLHNKSKNKSQSHLDTPMEVQEGYKNTENNEINMKTGFNQQDFEKQTINVSTADVPEEDDEDFTLEYDNGDEQVNEPLAADNNENKSNENINLVEEERNKTQSNKDELDDAHVEKQKDDNKQQYFKTSLIKDFDKQNKSSVKVIDINRSQSKGKQKQSLSDSQNNSRKSQNVTLDKVHQKTKNESRIEKDKIETNEETVTNNIENIDEGENVNESTPRNYSTKTNDENNSQNETDEADEENEQQNESQQLGNENEEQNESTQSNDGNEIRNKSKESEAKSKERNESTQSCHEREQQNGRSQSNNDIQNESIHSDVENENEQEDNNEDVDETVMEAEEEQNEQDESEDGQETEEQVQQDESEAEQETEEQIQQNDSEDINSDNQEQNDSKSNHNETEEQQNEAMEVEDEEEHESDVEEQNETENQENENYDSDDNLQNESNLSEDDEQEEQFESDQEQSKDVPDNEVIETSNHDATLRNKKKDPTIVKSPEVILHDKTNQMESFTAKGRNTSIRKTKSVIKNLTIKPSLAPVRESIVSSDVTRDSSAEGSGWDSHRTTRKTLRLTLGKDFTPRKSLRTLVMEKSAKRHTNVNEVTTKIPQANSTELPAFDSYEDAAEMNEIVEEPSDHEISARTRQTTLENFLQKIKQENLERRREMEEKVRASLKAPPRDIFNPFKIPLKPVRRIKPVQNKPRPKQTKPSVIPLDMLPPEVLEDMKYKPPKRFQPSNASWITKRLYKFLEKKLEPKYDYLARVRAERFVELLYSFTREVKRSKVASDQAVDTLKKEMARLQIVKTHFDFYEFFHEFMPREIRVKVIPDIINKISLPRGGVFSEILQ